MHTLAVLLSLVAGQSVDFYADEPADAAESAIAEVRAGGGATGVKDVEGMAATGEAGLELTPWGPLALRITFGGAARYTWGEFYLAPEAVFRFRPITSRFSPYLSAGLQTAVVNFREEAIPLESTSTLQGPLSGDEDDTPAAGALEGAGPTPLKFSAGPQLGAGLRVGGSGFGFDLGLRYTMLMWDGEPYHSLGLLLTVCAPAR